MKYFTVGRRGFFALMVVILGIVIPSSASATYLVFDDALNIIGHYADAHAPGTANFLRTGALAADATGGLMSTVSGSALVATAGGETPVATSFMLDVAAPALAESVVGLSRLATPLGVAYTGWQLYQTVTQAIKASGVSVCPPPNFFCVPGPPPPPTPPPSLQGTWVASGTSGTFTDLGSAEAAALVSYRASNGNCVPGPGVPFCPAAVSSCTQTVSGGQIIELCYAVQSSGNIGYPSPYEFTYITFSPSGSQTCPVGSTFDPASVMCVYPAGPPVMAPDPQLASAVASGLAADHSLAPAFANALMADASAHPGIFDPQMLVPGTTPVIVTTSPVTSPPVVINTVTTPNADGTTSTATTTETSTITPVVNNNSTVNNTSVYYQTVNNDSTTTVNNVTHASTTQTQQVVVPAQLPPDPLPSSPSQQFPTDYARENTQQSILTEMSGTNVTATYADQEARTAAGVSAADTGISREFTDLPSALQSDKANWFSWVWTPPTGTCSPFAGTVHGYAVSWDLCPTIANIRLVLGFLFALLGSWLIYGTIFRSAKS